MAKTKAAAKRRTASKKRKKKNGFDKKLVVPIIAGSVVLIIIIIVICSFNKKLVCTGTNTYDAGIKQTDEIIIGNSWGNVNSAKVKKTIVINDEFKSNEASYLEIIDGSLKESYKTKGINYSSKIEKNKLVITLTYDEDKAYILNDVDIVLSNEGVSVNVMTEDNNNSRITVDLSKKLTIKDAKKTIENKGYKCN